MLAERLRDLEHAGLIERRVSAPDSPPSVEYHLTARGRALEPLVEALRLYAAGESRDVSRARVPAIGSSMISSTPSSSPTRQTSSRSSSTSTQTPAENGKTTWSPGPDRHLDTGLTPPVASGADREHDPVLRRRLVRAGRNDEAGLADAVGLELLDDDTVEQRPQVLAHR